MRKCIHAKRATGIKTRKYTYCKLMGSIRACQPKNCNCAYYTAPTIVGFFKTLFKGGKH